MCTQVSAWCEHEHENKLYACVCETERTGVERSSGQRIAPAKYPLTTSLFFLNLTKIRASVFLLFVRVFVYLVFLLTLWSSLIAMKPFGLPVPRSLFLNAYSSPRGPYFFHNLFYVSSPGLLSRSSQSVFTNTVMIGCPEFSSRRGVCVW